jgi:hypothetical protein
MTLDDAQDLAVILVWVMCLSYVLWWVGTSGRKR